MEFFDPAKKRARSRRLIAGYFLLATLIGLILYFLLIQLFFGYDVDRRTGKIIQNGLVFVNSHPVSADIYINGEKKDTTDARLTMPEGDYSIELRRVGYRTWEKEFTLEGASIEQLVYPWLFPEKLVTTDQKTYTAKPMLASQSPDRRWLLVARPGSLGSFDQFDLNSSNVAQTTVTLPAGLLTARSGSHALKEVEWASTNRHLLLRHSYTGGFEFIVVDRTNPSSSVNLNKLFGVAPTSVSLRDKKFDKFYFYNSKDQTLSTAETGTRRRSVIIKKVLRFKAFKANTVIYTSLDDTSSKVIFNLWDGTKSYALRSYPKDDYILDIADFAGHNYSAIASKAAGIVYIYKDALGQAKDDGSAAPYISLRIARPQYLSFSHNARFIMAQAGNNFAVYDFENDRRYRFVLKQKVAVNVGATWMDGHRPIVVTEGKTIVTDFDGTNTQTLSASYSGYLPFFDSDYDNLFNVTASVSTPKRIAITRTPLTLNN